MNQSSFPRLRICQTQAISEILQRRTRVESWTWEFSLTRCWIIWCLTSIYKYKQVYRQGCSDQGLSEENSRLPRAARFLLSRWIWWMHTTESHTTWSSMPSSITSSLNGSSRREVPFEREKDWMLIWDEDTLPAQFPQHIYNTSQRPDIVVWSNSLREVVLIKLTCGDESKISDQVACKEARYNRELIPGIDGCGWKTWLFTVEIGGGF